VNGLYHFALLTPSRTSLAAGLKRLLQLEYPLQGAADHFVSEALYLADPEGNGIEIYADRPKEDWEWEQGKIRIGTIPLDIDSLMDEGSNQNDSLFALARGTVIGHVHLQVTNLAKAFDFYHRILGFDSMGLFGQSAAFFSVGGYHHHLGVNTWASDGGPSADQDMLGLVHFELLFPDTLSVDRLDAHLGEMDIKRENVEGALSFLDPSGNRIRLQADRS
jgi:catechol 2,3-dioxygenase